MSLESINKMRSIVGMSIDELSKKSGVPKSTLSKITSGITKDPGIETVKSIVYAMGFKLDDLDSLVLDSNYCGSKEKEQKASEQEYIKKYRVLDEHGKKVVDIILNELQRRNDFEKDNLIQIDLYDLPASAGIGEPIEGEYRTLIEVPDTALNRNADFCVKVSGDSMEPTFMDGNIVLVKKGQVHIGEVGIFILDGESFIKELGEGKLISHNSKYSDLRLEDFSNIYIAGKVIGVI